MLVEHNLTGSAMFRTVRESYYTASMNCKHCAGREAIHQHGIAGVADICMERVAVYTKLATRHALHTVDSI